jgi:uncharacterized protein YndB with AHSA1/START domain
MNTTTARAATAQLSDAPLGEVTMGDDTLEVVFHRRLRFPVEKVWAALTVPDRLADWFAEAVVDLRVGGTVSLDWNSKNQADMRITVCEPPHHLAWIWQLAGHDTLVRFDLKPEGTGCALTLTHSGVPLVGEGVRAGWHAHLEALPDAIEGRATPWEVKVAREKAIGPAYPRLGA